MSDKETFCEINDELGSKKLELESRGGARGGPKFTALRFSQGFDGFQCRSIQLPPKDDSYRSQDDKTAVRRVELQWREDGKVRTT